MRKVTSASLWMERKDKIQLLPTLPLHGQMKLRVEIKELAERAEYLEIEEANDGFTFNIK